MESLGIEQMASGHLCLNLTEQISWGDFPAYGAELISTLNGSLEEVVTSADLEMWDVSIDGVEVKLVFSDFPVMVSIESSHALGDTLLEKIYMKLNKS